VILNREIKSLARQWLSTRTVGRLLAQHRLPTLDPGFGCSCRCVTHRSALNGVIKVELGHRNCFPSSFSLRFYDNCIDDKQHVENTLCHRRYHTGWVCRLFSHLINDYVRYIGNISCSHKFFSCCSSCSSQLQLILSTWNTKLCISDTVLYSLHLIYYPWL